MYSPKSKRVSEDRIEMSQTAAREHQPRRLWRHVDLNLERKVRDLSGRGGSSEPEVGLAVARTITTSLRGFEMVPVASTVTRLACLDRHLQSQVGSAQTPRWDWSKRFVEDGSIGHSMTPRLAPSAHEARNG